MAVSKIGGPEKSKSLGPKFAFFPESLGRFWGQKSKSLVFWLFYTQTFFRKKKFGTDPKFFFEKFGTKKWQKGKKFGHFRDGHEKKISDALKKF